MPFKKIGNNEYSSPSGRHYNGAQVRLWHANGGKFPGEKGPGEMSNSYAKGGDVRSTSYAAGGPVLGRQRDFMKEPVSFRTDTGPGAKQDYGTKGSPAKRTGDKSLPVVKPHK